MQMTESASGSKEGWSDAESVWSENTPLWSLLSIPDEWLSPAERVFHTEKARKRVWVQTSSSSSAGMAHGSHDVVPVPLPDWLQARSLAGLASGILRAKVEHSRLDWTG